MPYTKNKDESNVSQGNEEMINETLDNTKEDMYIDDLSFEETEEEVNPALLLKKIRDKLRVCEQEKKEYLLGWQRMRADFANARKEEDARQGELVKFASEGLVEDLLPILDSFSMAFTNKEAWEKVDENWRKGVEYIHTQILSILESRGLIEIGTAGEKLDPRIHVAVEVEATDDKEQENIISAVIQKGYRLHSKVIRPARVKVFSYNKTIE
ncbi:MAG: nucleotide exchange factor GrpE [Candidatus Yonathbacteria bacterium]|nr:nucleotide exchange factor GrpE [Candidatus Yonathbacteria bacterium]